MYPILLSIGPVAFKTLALFIFSGVVACLFVVWKRGRELYFDEEPLFSVFLASYFWYIIAGRVAYIFVNMEEFGFSIGDWLNLIGKPGLLFWGGFAGMVVSIWRQSRNKKWDFYSVMDVVVVGLVIGQLFLTLGGFFDTVVGTTTRMPWGVTFPGLFDKRHPVQIYEFIGLLGLSYYLWQVESKYRRYLWYKGNLSQARSGFIFGVYMIGLGLLQFCLSWFRAGRVIIGNFSWDGWLWLVFLLIGKIVLLSRSGTKFNEAMTLKMRKTFTDYQRRQYKQVKWQRRSAK